MARLDDAVAEYLVSEGYGSIGTDLNFEVYDPKGSTDQILIQTLAIKKPIFLIGGQTLQQPGCRIVVRSISNSVARARILSIFDKLKQTRISGTVVITATRDPTYQGTDSNNLHSYRADFTAIMQPC